MESHAMSHKVTSAPSDIGKEMSPRRHYFGRPGGADDLCHDVSRLAQNIKKYSHNQPYLEGMETKKWVAMTRLQKLIVTQQ